MRYHDSVKKMRGIHHTDSESQAKKEMSAGKGQNDIKSPLTFCSCTDFILCCQVTRYICFVLAHIHIFPPALVLVVARLFLSMGALSRPVLGDAGL